MTAQYIIEVEGQSFALTERNTLVTVARRATIGEVIAYAKRMGLNIWEGGRKS